MTKPASIKDLRIEDLDGVPVGDYPDSALYQTHVLEQYKIYIQMADEISHRRHNANGFFLSVCTGLVGVLAVVNRELSLAWEATVCIAGMILCFAWRRTLRSYRDLNTAKFKIVHELERYLPLKPYDAEWSLVRRGGDDELYKPLSHVEATVPVVFAVLFVGLVVVQLIARIFA